jgi:hypothetical protein
VASASRRLRDDVATLASSVGIITSKGWRRDIDPRTGAQYASHSLWTPYMTRRKSKAGTEGIYQIPPRRRKELNEHREMIDLEVEGGLFLIGDGLVTHNSVIDRPTKSHEYLFLLTKNGSNPLIWRSPRYNGVVLQSGFERNHRARRSRRRRGSIEMERL